MPYTRRISAADAVDAGYPGYQVVYAPELRFCGQCNLPIRSSFRRPHRTSPAAQARQQR